MPLHQRRILRPCFHSQAHFVMMTRGSTKALPYITVHCFTAGSESVQPHSSPPNAQAYYTNPCVGLSNKEAHKRAFTNFSVVRLPYYRGFIHLVTLDAEIRRASNGSRSLDNVMLELLARMDASESFGIDTFFSFVSEDQQVLLSTAR